MSRKCVLVTGGNGYIGLHLIQKLVMEGYHVVSLDNHSPRKEFHGFDFSWEEGDLLDKEFLETLFLKYSFCLVFHLAAKIDVIESLSHPKLYFENNAMGTWNLLEAMKDVGLNKILFYSSSAVYGEVGKDCISEDEHPNPANPYGFSKYVCEEVILKEKQEKELDYAIFRNFNICGYGKNIFWSKPTSSIISQSVYHGIHNEKITINGNNFPTVDGFAHRDFLHVTDLVEYTYQGMLKLLSGSESFTVNVGMGRSISLKAILNEIEKQLGYPLKIEVLEKKKGDIASSSCSTQRLSEIFEYRPQYSDLKFIIESEIKAFKEKSTSDN